MKLPTLSEDQKRAELALLAMPVLVDRLGGTVDITQADLDVLHAKYGGIRKAAVTIRAIPDGFRYTVGPGPERTPLN